MSSKQPNRKNRANFGFCWTMGVIVCVLGHPNSTFKVRSSMILFILCLVNILSRMLNTHAERVWYVMNEMTYSQALKYG